MADLHLDIQLSLELRMAEFKSDPEKMQEVNAFLDELFKKAVKEAGQRKEVEEKAKAESSNSHNGTKKIGAWSSRARTSARSFASRLITTICNCTNSVRNVVINKN
ncbi:uncharacterized protein LOC123674889 [Harmonia axyridis]|uniref:uncharacterized protein LOC123674889 n=1 Tax=Harmonia axyridis TaxID=115357 RepID=UPI001E276A0D|nr:uncharacterized protein LOC123674889 [Harmonia axyridis]XP_045465989.1 uncharacterized protein LOC123674889 [Harmonia axyridis]